MLFSFSLFPIIFHWLQHLHFHSLLPLSIQYDGSKDIQDWTSEFSPWQRVDQARISSNEFEFCLYVIIFNKAGYTATPVACGWAGAIFKTTPSFGQEQ